MSELVDGDITELCDEIQSLATQIKTSILHLNNLRLLCELCEEKNDKVQYSAMSETFKVFIHLINTKPEYSSAFMYKSNNTIYQSKKHKKDQDDGVDQIIEFLHQKYKDFISILLSQHLQNSNSCLQV